jgi:hypothetical protein
MTPQFIGRRSFGLTLSLLLLIALLGNGCMAVIMDFPFQRGIRVKTTLNLVDNPTAPNIAIPNVPNFGDMASLRDDLAGTRTGTDTHVQGTTNQFGHSTYPNAITKADWALHVGPSVSPPCFQNTFVEVVPAAGAIFEFFCNV